MQFGYLYDVCTGTGEVSGGFMVLSHHHQVQQKTTALILQLA
jgi:hypothetical protein